ncbi:hypothetical protein [Bacillus sp. UNCCL81]|uniref:hypothetical protein n=1 Tax=Bacillus sp. UNCCL81 TaxID=1502755 RepID=UPI0008DF9489|nr:hypothetical protein [Bacillus sp. UNCCL81]SFC42423.1 hypothetical protein SAMN02799633_00760 [Bacillus sp. UNCCL81]
MDKTVVSELSKKIQQLLTLVEGDEKINLLQNVILNSLNYDQRKNNGLIFTDVKIKSKKLPKYHNEIYIGQVYEIFLEDIERYSYGLVISGNIKEDKYSDILIAYIDSFSTKQLSVDDIFKLIEQKKFIMIANTGYHAIRNYFWKLVSEYSYSVFTQDELKVIPYSTRFMDKYYMSIGVSDEEIANCIIIPEDEALKIKNPLGIIGDRVITKLLTEIYQNNY